MTSILLIGGFMGGQVLPVEFKGHDPRSIEVERSGVEDA